MTACPAEDFFATAFGSDASDALDDAIDSTPPTSHVRAKAVGARAEQLSSQEIREYMPMVHHMVSRLLGKIPVNVLREDLLAAGAFGLVTSMLRDGPERSPTFEWYARIRIRGAIMDELRNQDWLTRRARMRTSTPRSAIPSPRSAHPSWGSTISPAASSRSPPTRRSRRRPSS